jgi:hypothetical protein
MHQFQCHTCERRFKSEGAVLAHSEALDHFPYWDCNMCPDEFYNAEDLMEHKEEWHQSHCALCKELFEDILALRHHYQTSSAHPRCKKCQRGFANQEALDQHLHYSAAHEVTCPCCKKVFNEVQYRVHHAAEHQYYCTQCSETFSDESKLRLHTNTAHNRNCSCIYCNVVVATEKALEAHMDKLHSYNCEYCSSKFREYEARQKHNELEHLFRCPKCVVSLKTLLQLRQHVKDRHPLMCFQCTKTFDDTKALEHHLGSIGNCKSYHQSVPSQITESNSVLTKSMCPQCNLTFDNATAVINHYKWTHMDGSLYCPKCFNQCKDRSALLEHNVSVHMVQCHECDALFTNATALMRHAVVHTQTPAGNSLLLQTDTAPTTSTQAQGKAIMKDAPTKFAKHTCIPCNDTFSTDEEWQRHQDYSPFHQDKALECIECHVRFETQIELLQHLEASPHETQWVLVLI